MKTTVMRTDEEYKEARDDAEQHVKQQPWCNNGPVTVGICWNTIKGEQLLRCFGEACTSVSLMQHMAGSPAAAWTMGLASPC